MIINICSSETSVGVPKNLSGVQIPFSGNAYLGALFANYSGGMGSDGYSGPMWWEYIQGKLISPLEQGKMYMFSMEISLAEFSDLMISEIGIYISDTVISSFNTAPLTVIPQCTMSKPDYYRDTLNWMHIETYYLAVGGEKYITIGNFRDNTTTDTLRIKDVQQTYSSYFYIDNVVAKESSSLSIPNIFTPNKDGWNDTWYPIQIGKDISNWTCEIYNRWGNSIYKFSEFEPGWNGLDLNGNELSEGVYYYRIVNEKGVKSGFIELIR